MDSRKGVSPLVGVTILIVIVVAIAGMLFAWQSGFLSRYTRLSDEANELSLLCSHVSLSITNVTYNCSSSCAAGVLHTLKVSVRNYGSERVNVSLLYLKNLTGGLYDYEAGTLVDGDAAADIVRTDTRSCDGINRRTDEVVTTTSCTDIVGEYPGSEIIWLSC